jgi:hypothetical protein
LLGYFEYNGTVDIACSRIYNTEAELELHWSGDNVRTCNCGATGQSVVLYSHYGFGFWWPGRVCWHCMAITRGTQPSEEELTITPGHPHLDERLRTDYGTVLPCPKCGTGELVADGLTSPIRCKACGAQLYFFNLPLLRTSALRIT